VSESLLRERIPFDWWCLLVTPLIFCVADFFSAIMHYFLCGSLTKS